MRAKLLPLCAMFVCAGTVAMAQTMPTGALTYLDTDANAQVSEQEFVAQMTALFAPMDTDGNGQLQFAEVESFMSREIFDATDTNGSGTISVREYQTQILLDFRQADVDGDGVLD